MKLLIKIVLGNPDIPLFFYRNLAEDHGRKPVGESVPLKQMKDIV
jgi:hypothetical protein